MARKEQMLAGIDYDGSIIVGTEKNDYINKPCTVVIHEGKPERVFTESEVRAKDEDLKWAMTWMNNEAKHLRERGQPQEALEIAIDMVIERHGLHID